MLWSGRSTWFSTRIVVCLSNYLVRTGALCSPFGIFSLAIPITTGWRTIDIGRNEQATSGVKTPERRRQQIGHGFHGIVEPWRKLVMAHKERRGLFPLKIDCQSLVAGNSVAALSSWPTSRAIPTRTAIVHALGSYWYKHDNLKNFFGLASGSSSLSYINCTFE
jgi:hypothetical protein